MSDQLLIVLRICLLALVYLTFFRVLRAVWVELRAEVPHEVHVLAGVGAPVAPVAGSPTDGSAPNGATQLVVVAPPEMVGITYALASETTIGRAGGCGVSIDDSRVSKLHARIAFAEGQWMVDDLGSTNGTICNGELLVGPQTIESGDRIQIGDVVMELA